VARQQGHTWIAGAAGSDTAVVVAADSWAAHTAGETVVAAETAVAGGTESAVAADTGFGKEIVVGTASAVEAAGTEAVGTQEKNSSNGCFLANIPEVVVVAARWEDFAAAAGTGAVAVAAKQVLAQGKTQFHQN
jgi:predicted aspartyl protease